MDLFNLIRALNPTKVKVRSRHHAPHEVPLLTLTAPRVIEMDEPAATDSSGVPSTIERSPLDFAHEAGASDQGAAAPEIPSSEDVPATVASGVGQAEETATMDPPTAPESRKRGHDGIDVNAPQSHCGGIMLTHNPQGAPIRCPLLMLHHAIPLTLPSLPKVLLQQETRGLRMLLPLPRSGLRRVCTYRNGTEAGMKKAAEDKSTGLIKELEDLRARFSDLQVGNEHLSQQVATLQVQVSGEEKLKAAFEEFKRYEDERVEQRCAKLDARLDALSIDFDEELYPHMLTAIAGRKWVIGHGLRLAMMKCAKSLEMRQAFADVVSAGVAKGMSEGLKHGVEHGQAQLKSDGVPVSVPTMVPQGLALLLVDAATQTGLEDT
nr:hypothetical protein [Tanacetum cinerariifolium]